MTMMHSGVEPTITTFGTLLIAGAEAHDYSLVQEARSACPAPAQKERARVRPCEERSKHGKSRGECILSWHVQIHPV